MNQNLLPFHFKEMNRYGWGYAKFKLLLLRFTQSFTFKKSTGIIFLSDYWMKNFSGKTECKDLNTI